jgi:hypothetical protein
MARIGVFHTLEAGSIPVRGTLGPEDIGYQSAHIADHEKSIFNSCLTLEVIYYSWKETKVRKWQEIRRFATERNVARASCIDWSKKVW